jgi:hypothetical protein
MLDLFIFVIKICNSNIYLIYQLQTNADNKRRQNLSCSQQVVDDPSLPLHNMDDMRAMGFDEQHDNDHDESDGLFVCCFIKFVFYI